MIGDHMTKTIGDHVTKTIGVDPEVVNSMKVDDITLTTMIKEEITDKIIEANLLVKKTDIKKVVDCLRIKEVMFKIFGIL